MSSVADGAREDRGGSSPLSEFCALPRELQAQRVNSEFAQLAKLDQVPSDQMDRTFKTAVSAAHRDKNRYIDVLANEHTIYPPASSGRYINGNRIAGSDFHAALDFVACQAPLPQHMDEFWNAIVDSKTPAIINLTGVVEAGRIKSHVYWPEKVGETKKIGSSTAVKLLRVEKAASSPVRDTELRYLRHEGSGHEVVLAHFEGWPDMGVPDGTAGVRAIVEFIERLPNPARAPIFVHCSAGIGRTGTLIAAYLARQLIRQGAFTDASIYGIVAALKKARCGMVQRREQYGFVYACSIEDLRELADEPRSEGLRSKASRSELLDAPDAAE